MPEEKEVVETAPQPEPKKKGKLPLIIAIVVLIIIGVFVGTKKGGKAGPPPMELGENESLGTEFLVNLADGRSYLRTNISVQLAKTFKAEELKKYLPPVRDAVILSLASKGVEELNSIEGKEKLKREIAYKINEVLEEVVEKKPGEKSEHGPSKAPDAQKKQPESQTKQPSSIQNGSVDKGQAPLAQDSQQSIATPSPDSKTLSEESKPWDVPKEKRKHPDWDSDAGPVLMVYFTDFATQ